MLMISHDTSRFSNRSGRMSDVARERHTILVIDDSPDTLTMLTDALEQSGATVLVAISGEQALTLVERITPDLILLDAIMPNLDGFETCRRLRTMPAIAGTPIIFMTGLTETAHIVQGLEAGGVDYVTKPLVLEELLARIQVHLANARVARSTRAALDTVGRHLFATNRDGHILWSTPQARALLGLEDDSPGAEELPALARVIREALASEHAETTTPVFTTAHHQQVEVAYLGEISRGELLFRLTSQDSAVQADLLRKHFGLTMREAEVLVWIARGKSNRDVGDILGLSPRTVNKHLEQVFTKLGVENRASAASVAIRSLG